MLADLIICHFPSTCPIMSNSGSLCHPHALEEAPVAHWPDHGQLCRIWLIFELCTATHDPNIPWKYQAARSKQLGGDRLPTDQQTDRQTTRIQPPPLTCTFPPHSFFSFLIPKPHSLRSLGLDKNVKVKLNHTTHNGSMSLFKSRLEWQCKSCCPRCKNKWVGINEIPGAISFKLMGHFWWAIVVICAIVLIFARWAKKWVQNKTHHITITFSWLCDELIQATILLKWYLRSISQHLLFHPIVIKKWWKCDGPS